MLIDSCLRGYMRYAVRRQMRVRWTGRPFRPLPGGDGPRLLYVHVPFCEVLCPYCSFHRVRFEREAAVRYFRGLRRELAIYRDLGFRFEAAYIGGGTPTVLPGELAGLLAYMRELWPLRHVSAEAHPRHLTPEAVATLRDAGIGRLSVGVQTFDAALLERLSRHDGPDAGRLARERLRAVKGQFDTVNVDMMFNFPSQTTDQVLEDVRVLQDLEMDQVTFYPLMEGGDEFRRTFGRVSARREKRLFAAIVGALGKAYEPVSSWCFTRRSGAADEYIIAHDEYAGLGSGAFGYLNGTLYANSFDVDAYMAALAGGALPVVATRTFPEGARLRYALLMRLFGGCVDLDELAGRYGARPGRRLWKELLVLRLAGGLVARGSRLYTTARGRYCLVILMREFFAGVNRMRAYLNGGAGPPAAGRRGAASEALCAAGNRPG